MSFTFTETSINGVFIIKAAIFKDERGYFLENYKEEEFQKAGINIKFVQDNRSCSHKNVIRGLHFQKPPFAQAKLVQCIKGEVLDVAVDLRENSTTFGQHVGAILSEDNGTMLYMPEGFAHGFLALKENTIIAYKCSNYYSKEHEGGIIYNDETININWQVKNPVVSAKDLTLPRLKDISKHINYQE